MRPGESGMMFCPKISFWPNRRWVARIRSGCLPRTPVVWSGEVTTHRAQGLATRKETEPIRLRGHRRCVAPGAGDPFAELLRRAGVGQQQRVAVGEADDVAVRAVIGVHRPPG